MTDSTGITTSGGLISTHFIDAIRQPNTNQPGCAPERFAPPYGPPPKPRELEDNMATSWELLREQWDVVRDGLHEMDTPAVRQRWLRHLFDVLVFDLDYQRADTVVGDIRFPISHRGWKGDAAPPVHTVAPSQGLDERPQGRGQKAKSPHDTMQAYLIANREDLWGLVTNGIFLRVLRDYHHTYSKGFVEFDLEAIFETGSYADWRALYRMAHASRFVRDAEGSLPLELFYEQSLASGIQVGTNLRKNVRKAIEVLANGFLQGQHLTRVQDDEAELQGFYAELMRVIYRVLFLLFAEQRGMMPGRNSIYAREYSVSNLRERAERGEQHRDVHGDLWEGLKVTFRMVSEGVPSLDVPAFDGELFDNSKIPRLMSLSCSNGELLEAIRYLTLVEQEGVTQRISYAELGVEELGSVYESLLDFTPRVAKADLDLDGDAVFAGRFFLDPRGFERKSTGSYYTHPTLVSRLILSSLEPVLEERLTEAGEDKQAREEALLSIKVCDPACGSAAFLIAANNLLGAELARVRTGNDYPAEGQVRRARRDVLSHCIYGVDRNPMAVELAKVSLWINAAVSDKPLNFMDHHIKNGNSLIGATPELLKEGVPNAAFDPLEGDDERFAAAVKKRNQRERNGQDGLAYFKETESEELAMLSIVEDLAAVDPSRARAEYKKWQLLRERQRKSLVANLWTAAFFWPLRYGAPEPPTDSWLRRAEEAIGELSDETKVTLEALVEEYGFFHWHLEFPEVFDGRGEGFDCVLGNPPWKHIELKEQEWFAVPRPDIAKASSAKRKRMINELETEDTSLYRAFKKDARTANSYSQFVRNSGRFPLCGKKRVNTYAIFAETNRQIVSPTGRVGCIVPSGIATDDTTKEFFGDLVTTQTLVSFYDLHNKKQFFPDVNPTEKFCLLTMTGPADSVDATDFAFFVLDTSELDDPEKRFPLSAEDIQLLNPNTLTCPIFRVRRDAEINKDIYRRVPVLFDEARIDGNLWNIMYKQGLFNMSTDSNLFHIREELEANDWSLEGNSFVRHSDRFSPLYEAKLIHQYDHRFNTYDSVPFADRFKVKAPTLPLNKDGSEPFLLPLPRYWVDAERVDLRWPNRRNWCIGFRDVTNNTTNARTGMFTIVPKAAYGHVLPLLIMQEDQFNNKLPALLANLNSFICDYCLRCKINAKHLTYFILKQLPILPPVFYEQATPWAPETPLADWFLERVVELTYTAWDLEHFAQDFGYDGPPFEWEAERRLLLRCELDAAFFHLYGVEFDDVDYIMDTFPIVRRKDKQHYGEYRTKRLVLQKFDELAAQSVLVGKSAQL